MVYIRHLVGMAVGAGYRNAAGNGVLHRCQWRRSTAVIGMAVHAGVAGAVLGAVEIMLEKNGLPGTQAHRGAVDVVIIVVTDCAALLGTLGGIQRQDHNVPRHFRDERCGSRCSLSERR